MISTAEKRFIEIGPEVGNQVVVERGLGRGETVVTEGYHKITPGNLKSEKPYTLGFIIKQVSQQIQVHGFSNENPCTCICWDTCAINSSALLDFGLYIIFRCV